MAICHPDRRVSDVRETMIDQGLQFIPVIEHGKLLGVVTYADVVTYCDQPAPAEIPAYDAELVALAARSTGTFSDDLMGKLGK